MSARVLNFKATAVDWVALVSCTHERGRRRGLHIGNPVPGADSVSLCLLGKLKVGGGCVYRWTLSDSSL